MRFQARILRIFRLFLFALCVGSAAPSVAQDRTPYRLSVSDVVEVQIVEFNAEETVNRTWTALSREYVIDTDGNISIALLGFIPAAGRTLPELTDDVARALQDRIGLIEAPGLSVSIVRHGPVFVLGDVAAPGAYALTPGAPAVQALSLAGGLLGTTDARYTLTRDHISSASTIASARDERARLIAREARLAAESQDAEAMAPVGALDHPDGPEAEAAILADERRAFELAQSQFREEMAAFDRLEELLNAEVAAIERKIATQRERIASVDAAAERLNRLDERGLVRSDQMLAIQATQASLENGLIDLEQALFETRTRIAEVERDRRQTLAERERRAIVALSEVRQRLPVLEVAIEEARDKRRLAGRELGQLTGPEREVTVTYRLMRRNADGELIEREADATTEMMPSDVLTVTVETD
ncbi:exopolysaccharide production protein ExoF [Rhodovulum iodosum]|uniref:Exopolysaccharide production protein ExoF n=2 Tax=Rhodovulum iodosum TaxID=68291 RepID=A0ABV3XNG0_9RHOB|nr:polysaccharide biosynthesis/export family protein [Rhodovulum robiginosum]